MSSASKSIKAHEGLSLAAYPDKVKQPDGSMKKVATSVGYGYNMTANPSNSKKEFKKVGADYAKVLSGEEDLTREQADALFEISVGRAKQDAESWLKDFSSHTESVQQAVIEMSYQLGGGSLKKFKNTKKAFDRKDYEAAANGMLQSKWGKQTPKRVKTLANLVSGASDNAQEVGPPTKHQVMEDRIKSAKGGTSKLDVKALLANLGDLDEEEFQQKIEDEDKSMLTKDQIAKADNPQEYTVQSGDTLSRIAKRHGLDWRKLANDNAIDNPDVIAPGQIINLSQPDAGSEFDSDPYAIPGFDENMPLSEMLVGMKDTYEEPVPELPEETNDLYLGESILKKKKKKTGGVDDPDWKYTPPVMINGIN